MRLSVITDEISQDFERALDVAAEYGVKGAELRGLWGTNIGDLQADQTTRAKAALQQRGMTVAALSTPFFKCDLTSEDPSIAGRMHLAKARGFGEQIELLKRCCDLAHQFETDKIRVFTFWRRGELTPQIEQQIVDAFDEPIRVAEQEDVTLVVENEHACYIGTGAEAARLVSTLDSPRVRVCWDPGNAFCAGERPYPDGYEEVRALLGHVHVKDAVMDEGGKPRFVVIGEGEIDYPGQLEALRRDGYTGYLSLETHYVPAGGSPEDGSRACLAALRRFIPADS